MTSLHLQSLSLTGVKNLLRKWRENTDRKSSEIIQIWEYSLERQIHKLSHEKHIVLEQAAIASLDYSRLDIAEKCIQILSFDFPTSLRVHRLQAMYEQSIDCYDQACQVHDPVRKGEEANATVKKRNIALIKTKGSTSEAITELCLYLSRFFSDQEAWHELGNFYLEEKDLNKAVFCIEELLLHNPQSYLLHLRLGDIHYTLGGGENMAVARAYYLYSVKLNPRSIRAFYGLYLCCVFIANSKSAIAKRRDAQSLGYWVLDQITVNFNIPVTGDIMGFKAKLCLML